MKGPYLDLQSAKDELQEIAKNGDENQSRMMLEIIDGAIQVNPLTIDGISLDNPAAMATP